MKDTKPKTRRKTKEEKAREAAVAELFYYKIGELKKSVKGFARVGVYGQNHKPECVCSMRGQRFFATVDMADGIERAYWIDRAEIPKHFYSGMINKPNEWCAGFLKVGNRQTELTPQLTDAFYIFRVWEKRTAGRAELVGIGKNQENAYDTLITAARITATDTILDLYKKGKLKPTKETKP